MCVRMEILPTRCAHTITRLARALEIADAARAIEVREGGALDAGRTTIAHAWRRCQLTAALASTTTMTTTTMAAGLLRAQLGLRDRPAMPVKRRLEVP